MGKMMLAGHKTSSFSLKPTPFYLLAWKFSGFWRLNNLHLILETKICKISNLSVAKILQ